MKSKEDETSSMGRWSKYLTAVGVVIAVANMGAAWIMMWNITLMGQLSNIKISGRGHDTSIVALIANNQHMVNILGLAFSFALIAVGFSLFVMGIESAVQLKGEHKDFGGLALKTTSPGVVCFVLAAILISITLLAQPSFKTPEMEYESRAPQPEIDEPPDPFK